MNGENGGPKASQRCIIKTEGHPPADGQPPTDSEVVVNRKTAPEAQYAFRCVFRLRETASFFRGRLGAVPLDLRVDGADDERIQRFPARGGMILDGLLAALGDDEADAVVGFGHVAVDAVCSGSSTHESDLLLDDVGHFC